MTVKIIIERDDKSDAQSEVLALIAEVDGTETITEVLPLVDGQRIERYVYGQVQILIREKK